MKTNVFKVLVITTITIFLGVSHNVMSQNKVKKVKYLGHKYEGQVNGEKQPDGEGAINIGGLIIKGIFDGATVTNADVKKGNKSYIDASYNGTVLFNETNDITLKGGGKIHVSIIESKIYDENKNWMFDESDFISKHMDLKEDRIVNNENFDPEEFTITYTAEYVHENSTNYERRILPYRNINPPTLTYSYTINPSKIRLKRKMSGSSLDEVVDIKAFVDNPKNHCLRNLEGYKDNEGRIWDYSYKWTNGNLDMKLKITYPNGSYYYNDDKNERYQINYSDGRQLYYDNSFGYSIDNKVFLWAWDSNMATDIFCKYNNTFPPTGHVDILKDVNVKSEELSPSEIGEYIDKSIHVLVDNIEKLSTVININSNNEKDNVILGYMESGKYISKKDYEANKTAAEAKAEKMLQAQIAPFTKRFGFNPDGKGAKQIITSGRSFSLIKEWYNFRRDHKISYYFFNLSDDFGSEKCYGIYYAKDYFSNSGKRQGYVWVKGDKITSVSWHK